MELYAIKYVSKNRSFIGSFLYHSLYEVGEYVRRQQPNTDSKMEIIKLKVIK